MVPFSFAGHDFLADPQGALHWPAERALLVADLHLEKASWYARLGQFLPPYDSQATLAAQARWMLANPNVRASIEGHADERGTREYNIALGARRAAATRDFLIGQGVAGNRMKTISYGKERPVAVCDDISCWSQNRRAVTVLSSGAGA